MALVAAAPSASAAVACPNPVPVVDENSCHGTGDNGWRLTNYSDNVAGFSTKTSVNLGEDIVLKVGRNASVNSTKVDIDVYRIGYYGGPGGRRIAGASQANVTVNNTLSCGAMDPVTGKVDCGNWANTFTIPGASLPASGAYVAHIRATDNGWDNQIIFVVRDDNRTPKAKVIDVLGSNTWQAYNNWTGKSLYWDKNGGNATIAGTPRAVKVSFNRPLDQMDAERNRFRGPDYALIYWMERQGYDVSYSDDVSVGSNASELLQHQVAMISGHSEYWSRQEYLNFKAARDAGVNIVSMSANTAYWQVRYENGTRTLVCYKTVQGTGTSGTGNAGINDPGPDGVDGTADDAVGADGQAGTADDHPENATTTFRDNGAPPGDPNAPDEGRVGPDMPENSLFGVMYFGDDQSVSYPLKVPAANGSGEFAGHTAWRHAGLPTGLPSTLGSDVVGWEWDTIPTQAQYLGKQPSGVKRIAETPTPIAEWLQDEGRVYGPNPPPGLGGVTHAVEYTAASGARVFASGTMQWPYELSFFPDSRIWQATYNIFADMNVQPGTPEGIRLDGSDQPPTASFTATPNPALINQTVNFDASTSSDPDGPVTKYEWDLDGNGTYETNTGTTPTASRAYAAAGDVSVRLRVTDDEGTTGETNLTVTVVSTPSSGSYSQRVLGTSGLQNYWRMGELAGTTLADSKGTSNATISGASLGAPGALTGDTNTAVSFDGANDSATANVNLSNTPKATIEFWLKWDAFADDDSLAMELTPNFNGNAGGVLVDPNAPQENGKFGIGIGTGLSRNNAFIGRPSAGAWHHYAFVLDTTAGAANQITPYVDGEPVPFTKSQTGTGAGNFANSQLYFMSRAASQLFGAGDLDEVAVYNTALPASIISNHFAGGTNNSLPTASFTASPNPAQVGQTVTYNAAASTDSDGTIAKYEWDLDGDGSFETNTGTTPTATKAYQGPGDVTVKLRVTDNAGGTGTTTRTVTIQGTANTPPTASFTASTSTPSVGQTVTFNGTASSDPGGTITKFEWDLDGDGSFETDTGTTKTVTKTYGSADAIRVQLRVTDNGGGTGKAGRAITIAGSGTSYVEKVLATPGLLDYWRLSEAQGNTIFDRKGSNDATLVDGILGAGGALTGSGDANGATTFDGVNDAAQAPVNLSGTNKVTVEFWLKWNAFTDNDNLALEFTPNYNAGNGFIMDPNATLNSTGQFMVGIGADASRNLALFNRPSAGAWHHYAFVLDASAAAANQITPYVDGNPVTFTKPASGTGAGNFANSTLYFMSRAARSLFGAGDLDELALYSGALPAGTIKEHFAAGSQRPPSASFTTTPSSAQTRQTVSFNAGASTDPDGSIAKYEWDLDGNGSYETDTGTTATTSKVYDTTGTINVGLRVTDNSGVTATTTRAVTVTSSYAAAITGTTGLRGYWRLADTNSTADDSSTANSDGSYSGSPPVFTPLIAGEQNNSRDFNGSTQYVNMSPTALGTPTNVSAEAWVRTDTTKTSGNYHFLITDSNNDFADGFSLAIDSANRARFTVANSTSSTATATSAATLAPGSVHHVVGTYDRTRVRIYVDGVESASVPYTPAISWNGSRDLYLARAHATSSSTRFLDGKLDEAAVYNVALSAASVTSHYNAGRP